MSADPVSWHGVQDFASSVKHTLMGLDVPFSSLEFENEVSWLALCEAARSATRIAVNEAVQPTCKKSVCDSGQHSSLSSNYQIVTSAAGSPTFEHHQCELSCFLIGLLMEYHSNIRKNISHCYMSNPTRYYFYEVIIWEDLYWNSCLFLILRKPYLAHHEIALTWYSSLWLHSLNSTTKARILITCTFCDLSSDFSCRMHWLETTSSRVGISGGSSMWLAHFWL